MVDPPGQTTGTKPAEPTPAATGANGSGSGATGGGSDKK